VDQLKDYIVENIENFSADNEGFRSDFNMQKEIIRRYDEILIQKASKHLMKKDLQEINEEFAAKVHDVINMVSNTNGTVDKNK